MKFYWSYLCLINLLHSDNLLAQADLAENVINSKIRIKIRLLHRHKTDDWFEWCFNHVFDFSALIQDLIHKIEPISTYKDIFPEWKINVLPLNNRCFSTLFDYSITVWT